MSTSEPTDAKLLYGAWACLVEADSVLSEIAYRYGSRLPPDVLRDAKASSQECRRLAEQIKKIADELCNAS